MAATHSASETPERPGGFVDQIKAFLASGAGYLGARLELAGLETREALVHYLKLAAILAAACFGVLFGYVFFVGSLILMVAHFAGWPVMYVMLGFALLHVVLALACLLVAKLLFALPQFEMTLAELRKDQEWLRP